MLKISEEAKYLKSKGWNKKNPQRGNDEGDHPPLTPTVNVPFLGIKNRSKVVYEYIVKMFLATHSSDFIYKEVHAL